MRCVALPAGCGPECLVDPDCQYGYICSQQACVEKPDPCDPNPCGPGAQCLVSGGEATCSCPPGTVGEARTGCQRGECVLDQDCDVSRACQDFYCQGDYPAERDVSCCEGSKNSKCVCMHGNWKGNWNTVGSFITFKNYHKQEIFISFLPTLLIFLFILFFSDPCKTGTCSATDFCRVMNHRPICGFNYEAPPQVVQPREGVQISKKKNFKCGIFTRPVNLATKKDTQFLIDSNFLLNSSFPLVAKGTLESESRASSELVYLNVLNRQALEPNLKKNPNTWHSGLV